MRRLTVRTIRLDRPGTAVKADAQSRSNMMYFISPRHSGQLVETNIALRVAQSGHNIVSLRLDIPCISLSLYNLKFLPPTSAVMLSMNLKVLILCLLSLPLLISTTRAAALPLQQLTLGSAPELPDLSAELFRSVNGLLKSWSQAFDPNGR